MSRKVIKWDEEVIAEHNKERGTRQKIDEPPTPYHYGSDVESDDGSEHKSVENSDQIQNGAAPKLSENLNELNAKLNYAKYINEEGHDDNNDHKKKDFASKRANHYNEFKVIQALRSRNANENEDEDEDDESVSDKNTDVKMDTTTS